MAVTAGTPGGPVLPCGTPLDELLEVVAEPGVNPTPHMTSCPWCQEALAELTGTWAPVRAEAARPVPVPELLADAVIARLRALWSTDWVQLPSTGGRLRVAGAVLAEAASRAAAGVADVEPVGARIDEAGALVVSAALRYGAEGPAVFAALRREVSTVVTALAGITLPVIVEVVDVLPPEHQ